MPIQHSNQTTNLLEVLEKVLDKGVVIAGDIKIAIADVDLLTIKIRLLVASVDKAKEIGMNWWESDPYYSSKANSAEQNHSRLLERIDRLEQLVIANEVTPVDTPESVELRKEFEEKKQQIEVPLQTDEKGLPSVKKTNKLKDDMQS